MTIINQIIGILAIGAFTVIFSAVVWSILKATMGIRVEANEEAMGLDISEHGMEAYAGFMTESDTVGSSEASRV